MNEHVISLRGVTLRYDGRTILENVDFRLDRGEFCYLVGKTGSGKSSILKMIYRDVMPASGEVQVAEFDVHSMPESRVPHLRRRIGIVFQDFQLLQDRSAHDNVAFALRVTGTHPSMIRDRVMDVLGRVGLTHKRDAFPGDMSGGEQQRVVIARALANEPELILADEPTGNLDSEAARTIMELLMDISRRGVAVLMVTHDQSLVRQYPARKVLIQDGTLIKAPTLSTIR